jgi:hypothetical protein
MTEEEINKKVEKWHRGGRRSSGLKLHEYLGMTGKEYSNWLVTGLDSWMEEGGQGKS